MIPLFSIDLYKRTKWVKDIFESIEEQADGIVLKYYVKDQKFETYIEKNKLEVKESHTIDKYPKSILIFLNNGTEVAKFFSSPSFDTKELEELHKQVLKIKTNA